ncbi:MAG: N-acetylmuramoyl-L-alanine amidase [Pseudobdellovibrio sp.]
MKIGLPLIILIFSFFAVASENPFHIVIDPGHGGQDLGAVRDSFVEKQIVLEIAKKLKAQLELHTNVTASLTRHEDVGLSLKSRVQLAAELKADLFVSLHANTSFSSSMQGMEFYFNSADTLKFAEQTEENTPRVKNPNSAQVVDKIKNDFLFYDKTSKSLLLTKSIKDKYVDLEQKSIIKRAPFYVIDRTSMPSALIELGFISNRREAKKLASEEYQNELAGLLTNAIIEYKEKSDKL